MKVVFDIEANGLTNPTKIWVIVCKDISSGDYSIFRNVTDNPKELEKFNEYAKKVRLWIGHNTLYFDWPVLSNLVGHSIPDVAESIRDTFIISKLVNFSHKGGHSIEAYGEEFGIEKGSFYKFDDPELHNVNSILYKKLEEYCIRDVDISHKIYLKYLSYLNKEEHLPSIILEHKFQLIVNDLSNNGFSFNRSKAEGLLKKVEEDLKVLDEGILKEFPKKLKLVREITPKVTKHGTLSKTDFRWVEDGDLSIYNGGPFCRCVWTDFNPSSHKQLIEVLNKARWSPVDKTQTHIDTEREINRLKFKQKDAALDSILSSLYTKLEELGKTGFKINENNLATLPPDAPKAASILARRILLESRRRTLTEWIALVREDGRIHGRFQGIGAWTHRMAHQNPNTANIPNEFDTEGNVKLLGKELRQLWQAPKKRLLVGVDAEGIQLRIFAHYIDDKEFTDALVNGKKSDRSDPHSLNQRVLGEVCKTRAAAKRFIYALLLGAGISKLAQVLSTSEDEARGALDNLMSKYQGFAVLKTSIIPADAKRGWFIGLDQRKVSIPGDTPGERKHLCMSGYLQNGEAVVMKLATLKWYEQLKKFHDVIGKDWKLVNFVHDEWQTECSNNMETALLIARTQAEALRLVGEDLKLKCPLAGSYYNEDHKDYTIATNWYRTH